MRVVSQDEFGGPEVLHLAERPIPEPIPTEVRVRLCAAGVNPVDWKTRAGTGSAGVIGPPPFVLGWDVAGVVESVGRGVTRFAVGDRVMGMPRFPRQAGAYAEYVTAPSRQLVAIPAGVSDVDAAALPLGSLTAWQILVDTAAIAPGDRVLIHNASGGVGHLAVQIARARGATVIATASAAKHDWLRSLGADELIDYRAAAFEDLVRDMDVTVDLVGGHDSSRAIRTVRPGGLLVVVPSGGDPDVHEAARAAGIRSTGFLVEPDRTSLEAVADLVAAGRLRVTVGATFPLAAAAEAHRAGEAHAVTGKIALTID